MNHLRIFGCSAFAHVPKDERKKLDSKARKCILLVMEVKLKATCRITQNKEECLIIIIIIIITVFGAPRYASALLQY